MPRRTETFEHDDPGLGIPAATILDGEVVKGGPRRGPGRWRRARRDRPVVAADGTIRAGKLKGLSMWAAIRVLAWPVLIESFLNALVGLVDTALAANISEAATDAVGVASYFHWFINLIAIAIGVGATALISRAMGRGRVGVANVAVGQAVLLACFLGVLGGIAIAALAPFIVWFLQVKGPAAELALLYLRILATAVPAGTILFSCIACTRGAGDTTRPLVTMLVINIINVVVSFALAGQAIAYTTLNADGSRDINTIIANPFPFHMGVAGIAIGTSIAYNVGAVMMIFWLVRGVHGLRLKARRLRPHLHIIRRLVRVAFPNFLETFGMWAGNFLTIFIVGQMNQPGLFGAHMVAIRIEAFSFLPGFAMATAAATLTGQYLGAKSPRLARVAILRCAVLAALIMGMCGVAFVLVPRRIVGLFSRQELHLELTPTLLMICGLVQVPFAMAIVVRGALRGAGDTRATMRITWLSTWGIRLPLAWLFSGVDIHLGDVTIMNPDPLAAVGIFVPPLVGMWIGMCSELIMRGILYLGRLFSGKWETVRV